MTQNLVGQSLGRYLILDQIGEGGMAIVYKARDTRLDRNVALKVIRTEKLTLEMMEKTLKRFEREAKALARLTHTNIVQITDFGEHDGKPFLVMSYVSGGTLKQKLGAPLPWQDAARLLVPIARALNYAHQQGVIHRDVKPSNILLGPNNEPMLTDFGIAKVLLDTEETSDLTGTGMGIGTPEYMSPEQFQGIGVDARTDVYSLGVVLYEMITGRKPYTANTPAAILVKQATEPLPRPSTFVRDLPESVEKALVKALAKRPEDRYANMSEFLRQLENFASGKLSSATDDLTGTATVDDSYKSNATREMKDATYSTVNQNVYQRNTSQPPPPPRRTFSWIPWAVGSLGLCVVGLIAVAIIAMATGGGGGSNTPYAPEPSPYQEPTSQGGADNPNPTPWPTDTQSPTEAPPVIEPTQVSIPTVPPSCPGAKYPTRLQPDRDARVCTKSERLIVRTSAAMKASEVLSLYPGATVRIMEGPVCADNFWWWKIEIYPGTVFGKQGYGYSQTWTTDRSYAGWAREGWDNIDTYFICQ
jgi:serine/threonine protein kinase